MGLGGEDDVVIRFRRDHAPRLAGPLGKERTDAIAPDRARIVLEGDDTVSGVGVERRPQKLHQVLRRFHAVDDQAAFEEPVPGMLAVGLRDVEQLDVRRVATDVLAKQACVVVEVPVVERESHTPVHPLDGEASLLHDRDRPHGLRPDSVLECVERRRIGALGHAVVNLGEESRNLLLSQRPVRLEQEPAGPLDPADAVQAAGPAHRHGIRGPRRREVHAGTHFHEQASGGASSQSVFVRPRRQEAALPETLRLESLAQEPGEDPQVRIGQRAVRLDVEAVL